MFQVRPITRGAFAIALACSLSLSGCCVPKGYMIGGDWSIQLNRIPWIEHPTDCGSCGESNYSDSCPSCLNQANPDIRDDSPRVVSRLHPVPTHPVFQQRLIEPVDATSPSEEPQRVKASEELPAPKVLDSRRTDRQPQPSRLARRQDRSGDPSSWIFALPL